MVADVVGNKACANKLKPERMSMNLKIVTNHGEGRTVHTIVNLDAAEAEQPAAVCSFESLDYAKRFCGRRYAFNDFPDEFRTLLVRLAVQSGSTMDHVFGEYRTFANYCHFGDMSFLNSEFVTWFEARNPQKRILEAAWGDEIFAPVVRTAKQQAAIDAAKLKAGERKADEEYFPTKASVLESPNARRGMGL